jgi:hypothetical protein
MILKESINVDLVYWAYVLFITKKHHPLTYHQQKEFTNALVVARQATP